MPVYEIKITGDSKELFGLGIKSVFASQYGDRALKEYEIKDGKFYFAFLYHNPMKDGVPLPFPMKEEMAIEFIWQWLQHTTYPKNTYTGDGDTKKGFEIKSNWEGNYVAPFYTIYGK